jgi:predicted P-loop ATPase/GTPase
MVVVRRQKKILGVPERWRRQYQNENMTWKFGDDKREIYEKLTALDPKTMTAEQITEIIGNNTWTINRCSVCDSDKEVIVEFYGKRENGVTYYLSALCSECMQSALVSVDEAVES